jgi:hypothetical protein
MLAHPLMKKVTPAQLAQALFVLTGLGNVSAAQDEAQVAAVRTRTQALNRHLVDKAVFSNEIGFLASPVTGAGVPVGRIQQLFLRAIRRGRTTPQEWALDIWPLMEAQNQRLMRDGKPIASAAENIAELASMGQDFAQKRLPILDALGVIERAGSASTVSPDLSIAAA